MKYLVDRHTTDVAVNRTIAPGRAWQLESIRVHLSAGGAATNLVVSVDAGAGAVYDVVLATQAMNGVTDYFYKPDFPIPFGPDDAVNIAYANGGGAVIGTEVYFQPI